MDKIALLIKQIIKDKVKVEKPDNINVIVEK